MFEDADLELHTGVRRKDTASPTDYQRTLEFIWHPSAGFRSPRDVSLVSRQTGSNLDTVIREISLTSFSRPWCSEHVVPASSSALASAP